MSALAIALGLGAAVASMPGVAFATPSEADSAASASTDTERTGDDDSSSPPDNEPDTGDAAADPEAPEADDEDLNVAAELPDEAPDVDATDSDAETDEDPPVVPEDELPADRSDEPAGNRDDDIAQAQSQAPASSTTGDPHGDVTEDTATTTHDAVVEDLATADLTSVTTADDSVDPVAAEEFSATTDTPAATFAAISAPTVEPPQARNAVEALITGLLVFIGVHPDAATSSSPLGNPRLPFGIVTWVLHELRYTLFNQSPRMNPTQTGQTPTGVVTGHLNGKDFQGAPLTYGGTGPTAKGHVVIDAVTGEFTYTPNPEFAASGGVDRFVATASNTAAYQLPGLLGLVQHVVHRGAQFLGLAQSDTTTSQVVVTVVVTPPALIDIPEVDGYSVGATILSRDGSRAYQSTETYDPATGLYTTTVTVIDTATGAVIGAAATVPGRRVSNLEISGDGTRAVQTTAQSDPVTGAQLIQVSVIDITTGALLGEPVTIAGQHIAGTLQLSADGRRAFQTTKLQDPHTQLYTTTLMIVDTVTGAQVGDLITVDGSAYGPLPVASNPVQFSPDGRHAYLSTTNMDSGSDALAPQKTRLVIVDVATGALVVDPLTIDGVPSGAVTFSPDGSRAFRVTNVEPTMVGPDRDSTRVVVIDNATGEVVKTLELDGYVRTDPTAVSSGQLMRFSPDGKRAFVVTNVWNPETPSDTTNVVMIDVASGNLLGMPTIIDGRARQPLLVSGTDPDRFYLITAQFTTDPSDPESPDFTHISAIDATHGTLIGTVETVGVDFMDRQLVFSTDGTRAYQLTVDRLSGGQHAYVTVIDTAGWTKVGDTLDFGGIPVGNVQITQDGERVYLTMSGFKVIDDVLQAYTAVATIDSATGALIAQSDVAGATGTAVRLSTDGTRAYLLTGNRAYTFDAVSGALVGFTQFSGAAVGPLVFSGNVGDPMYLTTTRQISETQYAVVVRTIDSDDGTLLNTWTELSGQTVAAPIFSPDGGHRAYLSTYWQDSAGTWTTQVATFNTATGQLIGNPILLDGPLRSTVLLTPDGTRLEQTISVYNSATNSWNTGVALIDTHTPPVLSA